MMREWLGALSRKAGQGCKRCGRWCATAAAFFLDLSEWFETSARWREIRAAKDPSDEG